MFFKKNSVYFLTASVSKDAGYITLVSVLVVSAAGLAISVSLILLGIGVSRTSFVAEQSGKAKALADACAEAALQEIRYSTSFFGSGSLALGEGACDYTVTNDGGENRTITSTGTVGNIVRKVKVIINAINPAVETTSWQEVSDF